MKVVLRIRFPLGFTVAISYIKAPDIIRNILYQEKYFFSRWCNIRLGVISRTWRSGTEWFLRYSVWWELWLCFIPMYSRPISIIWRLLHSPLEMKRMMLSVLFSLSLSKPSFKKEYWDIFIWNCKIHGYDAASSVRIQFLGDAHGLMKIGILSRISESPQIICISFGFSKFWQWKPHRFNDFKSFHMNH